MQRQREHDVSLVLPTIRHLTERQHQLFFLVHSVIVKHKPQGLARFIDGDIAEAAGALAATLETAGRGVIYERAPQGPAAQALMVDIKASLSGLREQGATVYDGETAIVLRAIERGATEIRRPEGDDTAYADLMLRLLRTTAAPPSSSDPEPRGSGLVVT